MGPEREEDPSWTVRHEESLLFRRAILPSSCTHPFNAFAGILSAYDLGQRSGNATGRNGAADAPRHLSGAAMKANS